MSDSWLNYNSFSFCSPKIIPSDMKMWKTTNPSSWFLAGMVWFINYICLTVWGTGTQITNGEAEELFHRGGKRYPIRCPSSNECFLFLRAGCGACAVCVCCTQLCVCSSAAVCGLDGGTLVLVMAEWTMCTLGACFGNPGHVRMRVTRVTLTRVVLRRRPLLLFWW